LKLFAEVSNLKHFPELFTNLLSQRDLGPAQQIEMSALNAQWD
jgi:hypothetical protein